MQKAVIFDFDGVIVSTFDMCYEIVKKQHPDLTEEQYAERFYGNINDSSEAKSDHSKEFDFWELYTPAVMQKTVVPGLSEVVKTFSKEYLLSIVSSTHSDPIKKFLTKFELMPYFAEVYGNEVHFSKVEKFKMFFKQYNTSARESVFITDTLGDLREAAQVSLKSIAVTWGYHDASTLKQGEPAIIVEKPADLISAVKNIL